MKSIVGVLALAVCALASPLLPPIDPNNPLTNPATNRDLLLTNPAWIAPNGNGHMTPEQVQTIQNQMITQKNLEAYAAHLAAQAGVPPPAGIAPASGSDHIQAMALANAQIQAQVQAQNQLQAQAQEQVQKQLQFQAQAQAQAQAQLNNQAMAQSAIHNQAVAAAAAPAPNRGAAPQQAPAAQPAADSANVREVSGGKGDQSRVFY
ncbi:hypothetical protein H4R99_003115 [Coemansia sp. RSA 1722]|nr:hypothetical protein GGF39_003129 [Coemansia sp. RSA 1721]KAJ2601100.1 hypothetical protein H4R99_003115 [Coemansia sp. RSA 1722]KAJ2706325.1 hypothetical protein FB645_001720 [Coemansia sp. IMI 203386]